MKTILHKATERGVANHGWLNSHHSFSFGHYQNPEKINFGLLRVLNDDIIDGGTGFGAHPHDNMEIVSIPLEGALEHSDSTGRKEIIRKNDVQIMSAGTGIRHSEYNHLKEKKTAFLQIWVFPKKRNIEPRYEQKTFDPTARENKFQTVVAPDDENAVWINQDAWFTLANFSKNHTGTYNVHNCGNGVYVFVLNGEVVINNTTLGIRDALGIWDTDNFDITANEATELLLIEIPMKATH